jgi:DNA invertase Pin-like site-specific DNA recombinase
MAIYVYARASTPEQNVTIQEDALRRAGCEVIRSEKVSGSSRAGLSELALLLQFLRHGDTLRCPQTVVKFRVAKAAKDGVLGVKK